MIQKEQILKNDRNQIIIVEYYKEFEKTILSFYSKSSKVFETNAFIGRNGITTNKKEGDGKTPEGVWGLGIVFGMHKKEGIEGNKNIEYIQINKNLYWIDDIYSKYYNQLIDITKVNKDWQTAEHLIEYPKEYEYGVEIKSNPRNIPGKR